MRNSQQSNSCKKLSQCIALLIENNVLIPGRGKKTYFVQGPAKEINKKNKILFDSMIEHMDERELCPKVKLKGEDRLLRPGFVLNTVV